MLKSIDLCSIFLYDPIMGSNHLCCGSSFIMINVFFYMFDVMKQFLFDSCSSCKMLKVGVSKNIVTELKFQDLSYS